MACATPAVAGAISATREHGFDRCAVNGGPGQSIVAYLPKGETNLARKLEATLMPSAASQAAVAAQGKGTGKSARNAQCLKIREKRLSADLWRCEGQEYKGSHFPICAFTNNVGRRSPERLAARSRQWRSDDTSRSRGDAWAGRAPWEEDVVGVSSSASSSGWAGAGPADARQTQSSAVRHDWGGKTHWGGWNQWGSCKHAQLRRAR